MSNKGDQGPSDSARKYAVEEKDKELKETPKEEAPKAPEIKMINFSKFFTYMTFKDKLLMFFGTAGAIIAGVLLPSISIAMGAVTNTYNPHNTKEEVLNQMKMICLYINLVGIGCWIFGYIYFAFW